MLEFFVGDNAYENDLPYILEYVGHVTATNNLIDSFNREFQSRNEEEGREQEMRDFLLSLTSNVAYEEMVKLNRMHSEMWLLIRENHQYPIRSI